MRRFRLPEFVTPSGLEIFLQWPPSMKRLFHGAAATMPYEDWVISSDRSNVYQDICDLLGVPGGGGHMQSVVRRFEKKGRDFPSIAIGKIQSACSSIADSQLTIGWVLAHRSEIDEKDHEVAWFVFGYLASLGSGLNAQEYFVHAELEAIEDDAALREALGPYWIDWKAHHCPGQFVDEPDEIPPVGDDGATEQADDAAVWRERLRALADEAHDDAPLTHAFVDELRSLADDLDRSLEAQREAEVVRARDAIAADIALARSRLGEATGFPDATALLSSAAAAHDPALVRATIDRLIASIDVVADARIQVLTALDEEREAEQRGVASDEVLTAVHDAKLRRNAVYRSAIATLADLERCLLDAPQMTWAPGSAIAPSEARPHSGARRSAQPAAPPGQIAPAEPARREQPVDQIGRDRTAPDAESLGVPASVDAASTDAEAGSHPRPFEPADTVTEPAGRDTEDGRPTAPAPPVAAVEPADAQRTRALAWRALEAERDGLAAHLASAALALGALSFDGYDMALRALALGPAFVSDPDGQAAALFGAVELDLLGAVDRAAHDPELRLLVFAGALRPALFSSQTGAGEILRALDLGTFGPALRQLVRFVTEELPRRSGALNPLDLATAPDERAAREEAERRRDALLAYARTAPNRTSVYHRVDRIIVEVLRAGPVAKALDALERSDPAGATLAEEAAGWLAYDAEARATALDADARRVRREAPLEGLARKQLLASLQSLAADLSAWARAARASVFPRDARREETRALLQDGLAEASRGLGGPAFTGVSDPVLGALRRVLYQLDGLFDGRPASGRPEASLTPGQLLDDDLLLIDWEGHRPSHGAWTPTDAARLAVAAEALIDRPADFDAAFDRLVAASRFEDAAVAAERILEDSTARADRAARLTAARDAKHQALGRVVRTLRRRTDDLLGADAQGRVDPELLPAIERLGQALEGRPELIDFPQLLVDIAGRETAVDDLTQMLIEPFRAAVDNLERDGRDVGALRAMVSAGDLTVLRESIDAVRAGADLTVADRPGACLRAFAETCLSPEFERLDDAARNTADLVRAAELRARTDAVDFSRLPPEDVVGAQELLRAWSKVRTAAGEGGAALRSLFEALRFSGVKLSAGTTSGAARRFTLTCSPIADRAVCPIPDFGSGARGRYEILLIVRDAVRRGDEIVRHLHALQFPPTATLVVVTGGPLPTTRRREFLLAARGGGTPGPCGLIDEATILFLAAQPARGLADLFALALPSGRVQPYSDATGATAREMFFGRRRELEQLWARDGSCLVYGGRQLGKTALLDQIRARHDDGASQRVVSGSLQGRYDLWEWLRDLLRDAEITLKTTARPQRPDQRIEAWLAEDDARRLLILVDEADTYFEAELRDDYPTLTRVRDLMDATRRRCKFIFAGLHNVQRLAREPNSPLLHFGAPLSIGPLYGPDLGEARAMVELPAAAAGFVFADPHLPSRILSEVGYYPSLLQTFAKALLTRLNAAAGRHLGQRSPLITIAEAQLDATLEDSQFREEILRKFDGTLGLDERYRLITYAMLLHSLSARENGGQPAPLTETEARDLALGWWPAGFAEASSLDAFEGLLREMVGLGVLVETNGRYAIRSARIAAMLGTKRQVEDKLEEFLRRPGPDALDAGNLRRFVDDGRVPSPLTKRQITALFAPTRSALRVVIGTPALGLDDVAATVAQAGGASHVDVVTQAYTTLPAALAHVSALPAAEARRSVLLVLSGPWLGRPLVEALRDHDALRPRGRGRDTVQVLLVPTDIAWTDVGALDHEGRLWGAETTTLLPLGLDGLRQWCRKTEVADAGAVVGELRARLGGFPTLLERVGGATTAKILDSVDAEADRAAHDPGTLALLGLAAPEPRRAAALLRGPPQAETEILDFLALDEACGDAAARTALVRYLTATGALEGAGVDGALALNPFVEAALGARP